MTSLGEFAAELTAAQVKVQAVVRPVIAKTALETKRRLQQEATGHRRAPGLPASISYDLTSGGLGFECGPTKDGAGSLANFYYFGTSHSNALLPDPVIALHDEADKASEYLATAVMAVLQ